MINKYNGSRCVLPVAIHISHFHNDISPRPAQDTFRRPSTVFRYSYVNEFIAGHETVDRKN